MALTETEMHPIFNGTYPLELAGKAASRHCTHLASVITSNFLWGVVKVQAGKLMRGIFHDHPIKRNLMHIMMELILDFRHVFHMPVVCGAHMDPI